MAAAALRRIIVRASPGDPSRGLLVAGGLTVPCALGRSGVTRRKREGDGATPAGRAPPGVVPLPGRPRPPGRATGLPATPIRPDDGWCDDPADRRYNRPVPLPYPASHEASGASDRLYDVVVVLDWNLDPSDARRRQSAIFLHLAAPGMTPTAGCVAVTLPDDEEDPQTLSGPRRIST